MPRLSSPPPPPYAWLLAGYFHRRREYSVLRERGTDDWLLFFTLSGSGRFTHASGESFARPGSVMLYTPGTPQDYALERPDRAWEFLWFHFRPRAEWSELLKWPEIAPGLLHLTVQGRSLSRRMQTTLRAAHRFASTERRHSRLQAMHALEKFFLLCPETLPEIRALQLDPRIEKTMEYVQRHLQQPLTRETLARQAGLSTHRFAHLFQEQVGKSPRQFVEEERLKLATHLIETSRATLSEIAHETGFPNLFYFSQRFKAARGRSPSAFRTHLRTQARTMDAVD